MASNAITETMKGTWTLLGKQCTWNEIALMCSALPCTTTFWPNFRFEHSSKAKAEHVIAFHSGCHQRMISHGLIPAQETTKAT